MIKSFEKFNEMFDWKSASNLVEGEEVKNVVDGATSSTTQLIIVPPMERIDVDDELKEFFAEDGLSMVKSLCREMGAHTRLLKPGKYSVRRSRFAGDDDEVYLHFANADGLKSGNTGGEWDGGFLVLYKVTSNTDEKPVLRNLSKYPELP